MRANFKLALRVLARRKVFTAISLIGITLTLLVLVIVSTILENTFTPGKPESRFDRTLVLKMVNETGPESNILANPGFGFLKQTVFNLPHAERVAIYSETMADVIYDAGRRIDAQVKHADGEYWNVLDFHFVEGGPYSISDNDNDHNVAVISETMRDKLFGRTSVVGKSLNINGRTYRVAGVVSPVMITRQAAYADAWVPIGALNSEEKTALLGRFNALILADGRAGIPAMKREFQSRVARVQVNDPKQFTQVRAALDTTFEAFARLMTDNQFGDQAPNVIRAIMAVAALLFMMLPALNLVTLNLSRILERAPEIGVRKAFGAPRRALIAQFVTENILLTLIGGVLAFLITAILMRSLAGTVPYLERDLVINWRIFLYGMVAALVFGILSGAYPAWRMSRLDPVNALRGGAL